MEEAVKEAFGQIMKMAFLFFGIAILFIWVESKLVKKWRKNKDGKKRNLSK